MFLILEANRNGRWELSLDAEPSYDTQEEALEAGKELELFDAIIVEYKQFI